MPGFIILAGYSLVLGLIYCYLKKKGAIHKADVKNMIFAGGQVRSSTLVFSVFSAWMWTTSIFGATETYLLYGVWGPLGYVIGACISFALFIPFVCGLRKRMPESNTYLDFLQKRYGKKTKYFFYMFAFIISAYVLIEQAVGIASLMETFFGISFKWAAFISVMAAVCFICLSGMQGLLLNERMTFLIIIGGFLFFILFFLKDEMVYSPKDFLHTPEDWLVSSVWIPAFRYFVMAIVIGFSQLVFDPAYYLKGKMAKDQKQLKFSFFTGGILLWGILTLAASLYLGRASADLNGQVTDLFAGYGAVVFAIVILFIGGSTICHYLMGMLGIFTVDYYTSALRPGASEKQQLVFGRVMTVAVGIFCALVAISLENISLLTIDVFCAIFFAAPCGPLLFGYFSRRRFGKVPVIATAAGIIAGLIVWIATPDKGQWGQFLGMAVSLGLPFLIMVMRGYAFHFPEKKD